MTRIWMQKRAGSHDWQEKSAERKSLRTLLCICGCHLLSNFRFQQFKPQDVKFVIVLKNLYELWAVGLAFGRKLEALLNTGRIAWNKPLGILLNMQCFSRLLIGRLLLWWFNRNAIHNRFCFKHSLLQLVSGEIKFWNKKGGPGTRVGGGGLHEFNHAKQSAKWQDVPYRVWERKSSEKVKHIVRDSVSDKTGKQNNLVN